MFVTNISNDMAVDIKQLRIGAHVEVNGVRARVIELVEKHLHNQPWAMYAATIDGEYRTCGGFLQDAEPIPITPELLVELGFEKTPDVNIWRKQYSQSILILRRHNHEQWSCSVWQDGGCRAVMNFCRLHQFEYIIYLTLGKELIEG